MFTFTSTHSTMDMPRPPFPQYKSPCDPSSGFATDEEALEAWEAECEVYLGKYGGATVRDPWEEVPMVSPDTQTVLLPPIAWAIKRSIVFDDDSTRSQSPEAAQESKPAEQDNARPKQRLRTLSRVKSIFARTSRSSSTSSKSPRTSPRTPEQMFRG